MPFPSCLVNHFLWLAHYMFFLWSPALQVTGFLRSKSHLSHERSDRNASNEALKSVGIHSSLPRFISAWKHSTTWTQCCFNQLHMSREQKPKLHILHRKLPQTGFSCLSLKMVINGKEGHCLGGPVMFLLESRATFPTELHCNSAVPTPLLRFRGRGKSRPRERGQVCSPGVILWHKTVRCVCM